MLCFPWPRRTPEIATGLLATALLCLPLLGAAANDANAASPGRANLRAVQNGGRIAGLYFQKETTYTVTGEAFSKSDPAPFIVLRGGFNRPGWSLVLGRTPVPLDGRQQFAMRIPLHSVENWLYFSAVGPKGEVEQARLKVVLDTPTPSAKPVTKTPAETPIARAPRRFSLIPGLGYSMLTYQETGVSDFTETALTAKVSANYAIVPGRFTLGLTVFGTAAPISTNQAGITARYLGANIRFGWALPFMHSPWSASLMAGGYYTTMIVPGNAFGFSGLMGPQLFLTIGRSLSPLFSVGTYGKLALMGDGVSLNGTQNREVAGGLSLNRTFSNGQQISLTVDASDLAMTLDSTAIHSTSMSLGLSFQVL